MHDATPGKRFARSAAATLALAAALGVITAFPQVAFGDDLSDMASVQAKVQETTQTLNDANARVSEAQAQIDSLQAQIDENEARIAEIESQMPELKDRASSSIRLLYKMRQSSGSLLDLLFSADDFNSLISTIQYLDAVQSHNVDAVGSLASIADEYEQARLELVQQMNDAEDARTEAEDAQSDAEAALASAQQARADLQAKIEAQAAAEAAARQAAIEEAKREAEAAAAAAEQAKFETENGNTADVEIPTNTDAGTVDWSVPRDEFISSWAARIDAYLAGSPLEGQGTTFATAAYDYGVDPRLSPAISMVESSQGRYCFKSHNAWGWGNSSWDSWEEAINEHVAGLASGYGGTLTLAGAMKYCPPNYAAWYSSVLANMEKI